MELEVLYGNPGKKSKKRKAGKKAKTRKAKKSRKVAKKKTTKRKVKKTVKRKSAKRKTTKRKTTKKATTKKRKPAKKRKVKKAKTSKRRKSSKSPRKVKRTYTSSMAQLYASTKSRGKALARKASKKQRARLHKLGKSRLSIDKRVHAILKSIAKRHKIPNPMMTTYTSPMGKRSFVTLTDSERDTLVSLIEESEVGNREGWTKKDLAALALAKKKIAQDNKARAKLDEFKGRAGGSYQTASFKMVAGQSALKKSKKKKKAKKAKTKKRVSKKATKSTRKTTKKGARKMAKGKKRKSKKAQKNWNVALPKGGTVNFKAGKRRFKLKRTNPTVAMNPIPFVGDIQRSFGSLDKKALLIQGVMLAAAGAMYAILNVGIAKGLKPVPVLNKIPEILAKVPAAKALMPALLGGVVYLATKNQARRGGAMGYVNQFASALIMTGVVSAAANTVGPMLSAKLGMAGVPEGYGDADFGTIPDGYGDADFGGGMALLPEHFGEADFGEADFGTDTDTELDAYMNDRMSMGGVDFTPTSGVDFTPTSGVDFTPTSGMGDGEEYMGLC